MNSLNIRLCDWTGCPSIKADGKAADILAIYIGFAIIISVLIWVSSKVSRLA